MSANKLFKAVITKAVEQQILLEILPWEQILQEGLNTLSLACFLNQEKSFPASARASWHLFYNANSRLFLKALLLGFPSEFQFQCNYAWGWGLTLRKWRQVFCRLSLAQLSKDSCQTFVKEGENLAADIRCLLRGSDCWLRGNNAADAEFFFQVHFNTWPMGRNLWQKEPLFTVGKNGFWLDKILALKIAFASNLSSFRSELTFPLAY